MQDTEIKEVIRKQYGAIGRPAHDKAADGQVTPTGETASCCAPSGDAAVGCAPSGDVASCCAGLGRPPRLESGGRPTGPTSADVTSKGLGYTDEELGSVPEGANLGLGCGNPTGLASIKEGDTVLDLGSGGGFDCFLAANKTGKSGRVIGVDMTQEMIARARENVQKANYDNVEFRLGEIENLPVEDDSVDLVISNCVINLSTDKPQTFREAYRALKPGGSVSVSDIVLAKALPEDIRDSANAYAGCIAGALLKEDYLRAIRDAGFEDITITQEVSFPEETFQGSSDPIVQEVLSEAGTENPGRVVAEAIRSIRVTATKPEQVAYWPSAAFRERRAAKPQLEETIRR